MQSNTSNRVSNTIVAGEEIDALDCCGMVEYTCTVVVEELNEASILRA